MPADGTTSTDPVGILSAVFPGPVTIHRAPNGQILTAPAELQGRSRLCEQVWLEPALFHLPAGGTLFALAEETYAGHHSKSTSPMRPGMLGEQLLLREIAWDRLTSGIQLIVADARLRIVEVTPVQSSEGSIRVVQVQIAEEGLVEPGAPLLLA